MERVVTPQQSQRCGSHGSQLSGPGREEAGKPRPSWRTGRLSTSPPRQLYREGAPGASGGGLRGGRSVGQPVGKETTVALGAGKAYLNTPRENGTGASSSGRLGRLREDFPEEVTCDCDSDRTVPGLVGQGGREEGGGEGQV